MKTLTIIRHAKSSWNDPSLTDFQRPLNKRGVRDAPRIGEALHERGVSFDAVLCSDAQRAMQTLSLLGQGMAIDEEIVAYRHDMYGATANHLVSCIAEQPDSLSSIALVGHNPGMEDLAYKLAEQPVGHMSTCNVVQLLFECSKWSDLSPGTGKAALILRPREL